MLCSFAAVPTVAVAATLPGAPTDFALNTLDVHSRIRCGPGARTLGRLRSDGTMMTNDLEFVAHFFGGLFHHKGQTEDGDEARHEPNDCEDIHLISPS
jgi:hypothetical protein